MSIPHPQGSCRRHRDGKRITPMGGGNPNRTRIPLTRQEFMAKLWRQTCLQSRDGEGPNRRAKPRFHRGLSAMAPNGLGLRMLFVAALIGLVSAVPADPWPEWRGPTGNGISTETDLPIAWSAERNIAWKTPLPGRSASTPIVWGGRVFLTAQMGEGPIEEEPGVERTTSNPAGDPVDDQDQFDVRLWTLCFDAAAVQLF